MISPHAALVKVIFNRHSRDKGQKTEFGRSAYSVQKSGREWDDDEGWKEGEWKFVSVITDLVLASQPGSLETFKALIGNCTSSGDPTMQEGARALDAPWEPVVRKDVHTWFLGLHNDVIDNEGNWEMRYFVDEMQVSLRGPDPSDAADESPHSHDQMRFLLTKVLRRHHSERIEMLRIDMITEKAGMIECHITRHNRGGAVVESARLGLVVFDDRGEGSADPSWRVHSLASEIHSCADRSIAHGAPTPHEPWEGLARAELHRWFNDYRAAFESESADWAAVYFAVPLYLLNAV